MRKVLFIAVAAVLVVAGCDPNDNDKNEARKKDEQATAEIELGFLDAQPAPRRPYSQLRQNLIEIETAQMDSTQTTSFMFNQGAADPVAQCPSVGFPIPTTNQLSNPDKVIGGDTDVVISQIEPNGIYTGDSSGTYVMCIDGDGNAYALYWEGFVMAVAGPASWDATTKQVELVGAPSFDFSEAREQE